MTAITCARLTGLALLLLFTNCGDRNLPAGNAHHHDSAHGGVAVELGDHEFQLDFLHDASAGTMTAWVMDGHVEDFVRIAAKSFEVVISAGDQTHRLTLVALANEATGETAGDSAQFRGEAPWLKGLSSFNGVVSEIEVRGRRYTSVSFRYPR